MSSDLRAFLTTVAADIDAAFTALCPAPLPSTPYARAIEAMRYSFLAGGKRIRPALAVAWAESLGGNRDTAIQFGLALECVHTYSLMQDDLPCMDDDTLRRGKPTSHVQFDECTAILASDGLNTLAYQIIAQMTAPAEPKCQLSNLLSKASGIHGMIGGQMWDMLSEAPNANQLNQNELQNLQSMKTGAMITAACTGGAMIAQADTTAQDAAKTYGHALGTLFQVTDDLLDTRTDLDLGKTSGKDAAHNKQTIISLLGTGKAEAHADTLLADCLCALSALPKPDILNNMATFVRHREK